MSKVHLQIGLTREEYELIFFALALVPNQESTNAVRTKFHRIANDLGWHDDDYATYEDYEWADGHPLDFGDR